MQNQIRMTVCGEVTLLGSVAQSKGKGFIDKQMRKRG
jgi:hypothetical protein